MTRRGFFYVTAAAAPLCARSPFDAFSDGTPDFLRLDRDDERVFRRWFTFLAEAQYFQPVEMRPPEIVDCAALIRYAYREALRLHDSRWSADARVPLLTGADSIAAWHYPDPRLRANLFRVAPGPYDPADLGNGSFAQFADVKTLGRYNTHRIGRDLDRALPGDLLLYRQNADHLPFHSMIYLGASQISRDGGRYVVYHTGADGIMRRLSTTQLLSYPEPEWRALAANPNFLGVFRWNILRRAS